VRSLEERVMVLKDESEQIQSRLAHVEAGFTGVQRDIHALTSSVDRIMRAVDSLSREMVDSRKTPWGSLGTWGGAVIALMSLIGSAYVRDLGRLEAVQQMHAQDITSLSRNQGRFEEHNTGQDANSARRERRIDDLDERLRAQEMRRP
jgi:hypothetical protein